MPRQYSWFDQVGTFVSMVGFSVPTFFTGLVAIIIFSVHLNWLPMIYDTTLVVKDAASFWLQFKQMIMPVMVLALFNAAQLSRFMRSAMLDNLNLDYVRTARSKGLREKAVLLVHVLRNSLIPVVTLIALGIPAIFGGAIITEQIFRVNGLGQLLIIAIQGADIPLVDLAPFVFGPAGQTVGAGLPTTLAGSASTIFSRKAYKNLRFVLGTPGPKKLKRIKRRLAAGSG